MQQTTRALESTAATSADTAAEPPERPSRQSFTTAGHVPPVAGGAQAPAPTASELGYTAAGIPAADIMFEEMAHRMIYQDQLGTIDRQLLARWGYRPDWIPLHGKLGLFAALFVPEKTGVAPVVAFRGMRSEERRVGKECRSRWSPY